MDRDSGDFKVWELKIPPELEEQLLIEATSDQEPTVDPETGEMREPPEPEIDLEKLALYEDQIDVEDVTPHDFGRIAAQTAKQVILQRIREAERDLRYEEDAGREGDMVTGIIDKSDSRYTLLDLGRVEARMPQAEQVPFERYELGVSVRAYIVEVRKTTNGPQIVVSRTHPGLIKRLFELEVPEISSGVVEIKAVAREPGHRTKIAVWSNDPNVDAVGACVGARAARVRMVTNELRGEKVDIVPYSDDPAEFIQRALQPARVKGVHLDNETGTATVIVHDFQLSLAIGKEGQNARLAARLTGWRVDIKSESQLAGGPDQTTPPVPGLRSRGGPYVGPPGEPPTCPTCRVALAEQGVWSTLSFPSTEEGGAPRSFTVISCRACGTAVAVLPGDSRP
jgi:N utilization substance protein A